MKNLSAIIIAKNELADLEKCLRSLSGLAGEIVVVDDFSDDGTAEIAGRHTSKVFRRKFDTYGAQKQFALEKASLEWVLNLDADESLSEGLKEEIGRVLDRADDYSGFEVPFRVFFLGKFLKHGSSAGEAHLRLFRKSSGRYGSKAVHEGVSVDGRIGSLKNCIEHFPYADLREYFDKFNRYTSLIAEEKFKNGERFNMLQLFRLPAEFISRYVLKLGFLDGWQGFLYAFLAAFYSQVKYFKLWDIQRIKRSGG